MPTFCKTKKEAREAVEKQEEFPCLLVVWNAEEVRELFVDDQDEPLLTTEQAAEVLVSMGHNFDAEYGITNSRIWNACEHHFPTCGTCGNLETSCGCGREAVACKFCGKKDDARAIHICQKAVESVVANATAIVVAHANPEDKFVVWAARLAMKALGDNINVFNRGEADWFDEVYEKSRDHGTVRHEKNPVVQEICREAYHVIQRNRPRKNGTNHFGKLEVPMEDRSRQEKTRIKDAGPDTPVKDLVDEDGRSEEQFLQDLFSCGYCVECGRDVEDHTAVPLMGSWFARCDRPAIGEEARKYRDALDIAVQALMAVPGQPRRSSPEPADSTVSICSSALQAVAETVADDHETEVQNRQGQSALMVVEGIRSVLYQQPDGTWDPDKEWDSEVLDQIAVMVSEFFDDEGAPIP